MSLIKPFRALRPAPGRAEEVLAPPYDVLSSAEARARAKGKPWSFLHISKPEIDLDPATDPYDASVYAKGAENLRRMVDAGVLVRDEKPSYYVYRLTWRDRQQTGLAAVASVADYETNRIRKHEFTTPLKEDDRVRQIEAVNAQTGPVMIGYPASEEIDAMLANATRRPPEVDVTAPDGVRHEMWVVSDDDTIARLTRAFEALPAIYIADGHHRSAAAARVAASRGGKGGSHHDFLSVIFPHHQMTILDYNRLLRDLNGRTAEQLLAELRKDFSVQASDQPVRPAASGEFGMYLARFQAEWAPVSRPESAPLLESRARSNAKPDSTFAERALDGRWYRLTIRPELVPSKDPIGRLPITLLTKHAIEPLFGIADPRTDKRIDFVGGARGLGELEKRVNSGEMAAAFALYPTQMSDLMAVADAGGIMPPKSTWFEPKLADGMVNHVLD